MPTKPAPIEFLDFHEVSKRVCLRRTTIYKLISESAFPRPVRIGLKAVRWDAAEVDSWQRERLAARGAA